MVCDNKQLYLKMLLGKDMTLVIYERHLQMQATEL